MARNVEDINTAQSGINHARQLLEDGFQELYVGIGCSALSLGIIFEKSHAIGYVMLLTSSSLPLKAGFKIGRAIGETANLQVQSQIDGSEVSAI